MMNKLWVPDFLSKNIGEVYTQATTTEIEEGKDWYANASLFASDLASEHNTTRLIASGVVAAMSPMKSWLENKKIADLYFRGIYKHTVVQVNKCREIEKSGKYANIIYHLGGLKTKNFFNNILDPSAKNHCTIDRHIIYLSTGVDFQRITEHRYNIIKGCYINIARELKLLPCELQAITWICWKRIKKKNP